MYLSKNPNVQSLRNAVYFKIGSMSQIGENMRDTSRWVQTRAPTKTNLFQYADNAVRSNENQLWTRFISSFSKEKAFSTFWSFVFASLVFNLESITIHHYGWDSIIWFYSIETDFRACQFRSFSLALFYNTHTYLNVFIHLSEWKIKSNTSHLFSHSDFKYINLTTSGMSARMWVFLSRLQSCT